MSIWASVWKNEAADEGWDCRASNLHSDAVDEYAGTGPDDLGIGVATATSWNDRIRLSVSELDDGPPVDICLLLNVESAEALRDMLNVALARIRDARES